MESERSENPVRRRRSLAVVTARFESHPATKRGTTLVVLAANAPSLVREACRRARANHEAEIFCVCVCTSGRFRPADERSALEAAARAALEEGIRLLPVTRLPGDAVDTITRAAEESGARVILMNGVERRAPIARALGRRMLCRIRRRLSAERSILLYD